MSYIFSIEYGIVFGILDEWSWEYPAQENLSKS